MIGKLFDAVLALAMRFLNWRRLRDLERGGPSRQLERKLALVRALQESPRALDTERANQQHYELPTAFFEAVLGPNLKYSSAYWPDGVDSLAAAEEAMLELYAERAQLEDGQSILELGCGWGSLTLWMARRYPNSRILAISNSHRQRQFLEERLRQEGLSHVEIRTVDVCRLDLPEAAYDRVVSVEMLEHVRNYREMFALLHRSLRTGGKLFTHVFCHAHHPYLFDFGQGWMERYFFSGGVMPSQDLYLYFAQGFRVDAHWVLEGRHYERTARAWLSNMRARRAELQPILRAHYGSDWRRWWIFWQVFFLACAEMFGYQQGRQWLVCHQLWSKEDQPG